MQALASGSACFACRSPPLDLSCRERAASHCTAQPQLLKQTERLHRLQARGGLITCAQLTPSLGTVSLSAGPQAEAQALRALQKAVTPVHTGSARCGSQGNTNMRVARRHKGSATLLPTEPTWMLAQPGTGRCSKLLHDPVR